mmetsp:Transcript_11983/g.28506  ORF Transcript_11983/g.28506 Transcript_11983/m.28506 type:complete len:298 (-) Transcript_11983:227-1120(-)
MHIRQRMIGSNPSKIVRVGNHSPEEVHSLARQDSVHLDHSAIFNGLGAHHNLGPGRDGDTLHCVGQRGGANLGTTTATAHVVLQQLQGVLPGNLGRGGDNAVTWHVRQPQGVVPHPLPIDPVLEVPHPPRAPGQLPPASHRRAVPKPNDSQELGLRVVMLQRLPTSNQSNVASQGQARKDSKHTGLRPLVSLDGGSIARCKDRGVPECLQSGGRLDESVLVHRQTTLGKPLLRCALCAPQCFRERNPVTLLRHQSAVLNPHHLLSGVQLNATFPDNLHHHFLHGRSMVRTELLSSSN